MQWAVTTFTWTIFKNFGLATLALEGAAVWCTARAGGSVRRLAAAAAVLGHPILLLISLDMSFHFILIMSY